MAEAGGPTIAEMQPKPAGVVDKVKGALRKMFTVEGRAEVMAQKQIDAILAQVPEEKRVEAMKMLEARRPDLVAGKMEDAKGSLVRDAVVVSAIAGTVLVGAGAVYWQKDNIGKGIGKVGETFMGKLSIDNKVKVMSAMQNVNDFRAKVDQQINNIRNRVTGLWQKPLDIKVGTSSTPDIKTI
ncbi:MAG: hypothetical protein Q8L37_03130 [Candidatus Gottesmanbacteria bacterium]|nr:hypothetical protein [Candidatus Gottesmanbacteria bacterium]